MTASEALPEQQYQLPYPTTMPLAVDSCSKSCAEKDHESTSYHVIFFS